MVKPSSEHNEAIEKAKYLAHDLMLATHKGHIELVVEMLTFQYGPELTHELLSRMLRAHLNNEE